MSATHERFTVPSLDGVTLHRVRRGDPAHPLVVLLHGGGANVHWWDHVAPELAAHFHVVALDFRGHGESDHPETLKVGAFSDDLAALLEDLGHPEVVLVGHSLGGHVALECAATAERTRALVLIDVSWGAPPRTRRVARRVLATARRSFATREEALARYSLVPPALGIREDLRRHLAEHSVRRDAEGRFAYAFDPRWFSLPARPAPPLADVTCPTLILRGSESRMLPADGAKQLASGLPRATLVEVAGAGHHVHLDRPDEVRSALRAFLAEHA